jgi:hypothetical protein
MTPSTPPKGSLEDLFRHHLLESEAAAVRPRPQVWEQVDNSLLLAQNEKYRRRLLAYRWAMAASLLLASLAGGGWWRSQHNAALTPSLAQATRPSADGSGPASMATTATLASLSTSTSPAIDQTATLSASAYPTTRVTAPGRRQGQLASKYSSASRYSSPTTASLAYGRLSAPAQQKDAAQLARLSQLAATGQVTTDAGHNLLGTTNAEPATTLAALASTQQPNGAAQPAATTELAEDTEQPTMGATTTPLTAEAILASRLASLSAPTAAGLPASLSEVAVAPGPPTELARRWQYGLSYSASAYQPNIDWAKPTVAYSNSFGLNSAILTRSAASEYRDNLRPGLGQRLTLWANRRLGNGRWTLRTGLEVNQNTASSASSVAFVGEQVADLSYTQAGAHPLRRTSYRYRSVSVPAELRYSNPMKTGFSFYGRVGAFVSALLNVRSEVEGNPEAERTYSLNSTSTPYRPVSGGLRVGGGMQYRPAGHQWSLNFGPVAELGILSLNADPSQDFWGQQRPYSFGLEAGMELGRGFKIQ